ncbi:hypothetical protein EVAR_88780_1 [Eumeta japonica]|uniref:Uncharacterized protein n=1 Tax=Eumeta variegata TaxID=151549 RepID=A0A4C1XR74_EUMVA|nr:hypothetical protein EVAR_88780_1 [Eumeta japonica]
MNPWAKMELALRIELKTEPGARPRSESLHAGEALTRASAGGAGALTRQATDETGIFKRMGRTPVDLPINFPLGPPYKGYANLRYPTILISKRLPQCMCIKIRTARRNHLDRVEFSRELCRNNHNRVSAESFRHASSTFRPFIIDADRAPPAGRDRRYKRRCDFRNDGTIVEY